MGALITLIDSILFIIFIVIAISAPLVDAQTCLPLHIFPNSLIQLKLWYANQYGDYLFLEHPPFFVGLVWVELLFQWPLSLMNLYGIASRKGWVNTTCLMYGVSCFTSMVSVLAELMGSGKASDRLLTLYFPFLGFAVLCILRGLIIPASIPNKKIVLGRKKMT